MSTVGRFTRRVAAGVAVRRDDPEVEAELDRPVPGWWLLVGTSVLVTFMLLVAWASVGPVNVVAVVLCAVGGFLVAAVPGLARVGVAVLAVGGFVLVGAPSVAQTLALVLLVHVVVWACATTTRVTWRMRVELGVVLDGLADVARVQVPAQVLAVVALVVSGREVGTGDVWRVVALVGAALVAAVTLPRAARD